MKVSDIDHRHVASLCPVCGYKLDGSTGIGTDNAPVSGDYTVCFGCTSFLVFGDNLSLREMTQDEVPELAAEDRALLVRARDAITETKQRLSDTRSPR